MDCATVFFKNILKIIYLKFWSFDENSFFSKKYEFDKCSINKSSFIKFKFSMNSLNWCVWYNG